MNGHKNSLRRRPPSSQSNDANFFSSPSQSSLTSFTIKRNGFDPEKPVHVAQDSLFSGSSGWKDYRGFFNLAVLLLYGVLVSPTTWKWLNSQLAFAFYLCLFSLHISVPAVVTWILQVILELISTVCFLAS
uniref:Uncharacterized protein n=1 Tax=Wuchereria bancrofti TaxID=6293 RepID=A0A1I8F132_WUCBA